jgi:hypothetical protein
MDRTDDELTPERAAEAEPPVFPWPPRDGESLVDAAAATWRASMFAPASFFSRMPRESGVGSAIGWFVVLTLIGIGLQFFWDALLPGWGPDEYEVADGAGMPGGVSTVLLGPPLAILLLFIMAAVLHFVLWILGGARQSLLTTLRTLCFAWGSPSLLQAIPWIGSLIGAVWGVVLAIIGLREAHATTTGRAAAAVLLPVILVLIVAAVAIVMLVWSGMIEPLIS